MALRHKHHLKFWLYKFYVPISYSEIEFESPVAFVMCCSSSVSNNLCNIKLQGT